MAYKKSKTRIYKKTKIRKRKKNKTQKIKQFRGGFTNPFYEVGNVVSTLGNVVQNTMGNFFIPPTPTHIPNTVNPHPVYQYQNSMVTRPLAELYK